MYAKLRRFFYWPHMSADIFSTVRYFSSCARERFKQRKRREPLELFQSTGPLEDEGIELLGPFSITKQGFNSLLVMTERFVKLTQFIPLRTTEAYDCAVAFVKHWVYKFGAPARLLSDNGPKLMARVSKPRTNS